MSSPKASYFKIGVFVLAGFLLGIGVIVVLGVGALFQRYVVVETYFNETVKGLEVDSAVFLRGVEVGKVLDIGFVRDAYGWKRGDPHIDEWGNWIFVRVGLFRTSGSKEEEKARLELLSEQIRRGLRLTLARNAISGLAYIEGDYFDPGSTPEIGVPWKPRGIYIPSAPNTLTRLSRSIFEVFDRLKETKLEELVEAARRFLDRSAERIDAIDAATLSDEAIGALSSLRSVLDEVERLLEGPKGQSIPGDVASIVTSLRETIVGSEDEIRTTIRELAAASEQTNKLLVRANTLLDGDVSRTAHNVAAGTDELPELVAELSRLGRRLDRIASSRQGDLAEVIENLRTITENLEELTENAKRYPAFTIFGEAPEKTEPKR